MGGRCVGGDTRADTVITTLYTLINYRYGKTTKIIIDGVYKRVILKVNILIVLLIQKSRTVHFAKYASFISLANQKVSNVFIHYNCNSFKIEYLVYIVGM